MMTTPTSSLLARASAYTRSHARRSGLAIMPLAALGLTAESAQAFVTAGPPTLNPGGTLTYGTTSLGGGSGYDSNSKFYTNNGNITGSALSTGANGVTGAKYQGSVSFVDQEGSAAGTLGSIQMFSLTGTASGTLSAAQATIPIFYNFTLGASSGPYSLSINSWVLKLSITSSTGTGMATVNSTTGGAGTFSGSTLVTVPGAGSGGTLSGYAGSLTINYGESGTTSGSVLSVTVPANSIDFNAVPEPYSWVILATGVAGAGLHIMRVRGQRGKAAPLA